MYLTNHVALDLGLEGTPDPSWDVVNEAAQARSYTGYICPEYDYTIPPLAQGAVPAHHDPAPSPAPPAAKGGGSPAPPAAKGGGSPAPSAKQSRKG